MLRAFIFFIVFTLLGAVRAFAGDPFTVTAVPFDADGKNAIQAQTKALAEGQVMAARIMIDRLNARPGASIPAITPQTAAKMMRAMSLANERRSNSRYMGDITVAFNPQAVQTFARENGLTLVTQQDAPRLVIPLSPNGFADGAQWFTDFREGGYDNGLAPLVALPDDQRYSGYIRADAARSGDLDALRQTGRAVGVTNVLIASANSAGTRITLTDIALDTGRTSDLGTVSSNAEMAARMDNAWKKRATAKPAKTHEMTVTVLYSSHQDWQRIQRLINGSSLISGARLDALSKDGALMRLTVSGPMDDLVKELEYRGVEIKELPPIGTVMRFAGR
ncbi:hypothetical protein [Robiginitomaculum antarcticum]|uniref:hypothetical protein n=1 Tax=Robiginitomaculum antarcticum TaxID=437507 RepID=UPI0003728C66|nr:hypothetical protein [Robiginitomaculum antarcticum]